MRFKSGSALTATARRGRASSGLPGSAVAVGLALGGLATSPTLALASCPPLASQSSLLRPPPGHGLPSGPVAPEQLPELMKKGGVSPVQAFPSSGPVPLPVEVRWLFYPVDDPTRVEFDADGDGVPESSASTYGSTRYTYQRAGQFQATMRVRDRQGRLTTYATQVTAMAPAAFDAELQSRWATLKAALRRGDIPAALECLHSGSRSRYQPAFAALARQAPREVDRILAGIRFVEHRDGEAIYEMRRVEVGEERAFDVRFMVDTDGVWRLRSF